MQMLRGLNHDKVDTSVILTRRVENNVRIAVVVRFEQAVLCVQKYTLKIEGFLFICSLLNDAASSPGCHSTGG
jgi:hypothetical protein